jgi:adenosylcobyric acid synthase
MLSRIANFDDLDPLILEPDVDVRFVKPGSPLPCEADLVIIPGTKSTLSDLKVFKNQGWDIDLYAHVRRGGKVLGICGGYQMLGETVSDKQGIEGIEGSQKALGLLNVNTEMMPEKSVCKTAAYCPSLDCETTGYEIHMGETIGGDTKRPFLEKDNIPLGAMSENGNIAGVYVHGLFIDDNFRAKFLSQFRNGQYRKMAFMTQVEKALDTLADEMEVHLDIDEMLRMASE